jgi:NADH-quinone oxidoreductase subunit N
VQLTDVLPEIAVLLAAVALLLAALVLPAGRQHWCAVLALLALVVAGLLCAKQLTGSPHLGMGNTWAVDGAAIWARLLIVVTTAACVLLAPPWLRTDRRHGEFYAVLLLGALGAMLMAGAADLLQLALAMLLSSVTGYVLAAWHRAWALSVEAGMKYFLVGLFTNTLLLVGITLLFGLTGSTRLHALAPALAAVPRSPLLPIGLGLTLIGVLFKLGAAPAHPWVPDVAQGAPAPSAAFLTVAPKVGAAIALARLLQAFPAQAESWRPLMASLALVTMTLGNLMALWQSDLRRLLGWSSVSQAGYALMALAVLGTRVQAIPALLFFLAGYAAANTCAFAALTHLRGRTDLAHYRGLLASQPWTVAALALALLSLVGIPPLAGFVGKLGLFTVAIDGGATWLAVAAIVNTVVSLFYYLRVVGTMVLDAPGAPAQTLGAWSAVALALLALLVLLLGMVAPLQGWPLASQGHLLAP